MTSLKNDFDYARLYVLTLPHSCDVHLDLNANNRDRLCHRAQVEKMHPYSVLIAETKDRLESMLREHSQHDESTVRRYEDEQGMQAEFIFASTEAVASQVSSHLHELFGNRPMPQ